MAMSAVERRQKTADTLVGIQGFRSKGEEERAVFRESLQGEKGQRKRKGRKAGKNLPPMRCIRLWKKSLLLAEHGKCSRMELGWAWGTVPPGTQTCAYEDSSAGTLPSPSPNAQTSVLGEHLVWREREGAASSKTALMLPTSHPLSAARSSWAITQEQGGCPGPSAGGGSEAGAAARGTVAPYPPTIPPLRGSVEGVLVLHCPGPTAGTVSIMVVLSAGGRGLWPALSAVAAAAGAQGSLQAVVGRGDGGGHSHPLSGWWDWRGSGRCVAEIVWGWWVGAAERRLWHEGWRRANVCKGIIEYLKLEGTHSTARKRDRTSESTVQMLMEWGAQPL